MSTSEYLRCAPKYTISRLHNQPSPHPTPLGASGASILAPSALATRRLWRLDFGGGQCPPKYFFLEPRLVLAMWSCNAAGRSGMRIYAGRRGVSPEYILGAPMQLRIVPQTSQDFHFSKIRSTVLFITQFHIKLKHVTDTLRHLCV